MTLNIIKLKCNLTNNRNLASISTFVVCDVSFFAASVVVAESSVLCTGFVVKRPAHCNSAKRYFRMSENLFIVRRSAVKFIAKLLKHQVFALVILIAISNCSLAQSTVDPTGTFEYQGKTIKKNGDLYGCYGTIQVKKIADTKIIMTFSICIGAPSLNSGSFVDTLDYVANSSTYTCEGHLTNFAFTKNGAVVSENSQGSCWGHGVYAQVRFRKKSKKEPTLIEP